MKKHGIDDDLSLFESPRDKIRSPESELLSIDSWSEFKGFKDKLTDNIDYNDPVISKHIAELALAAEAKGSSDIDDAYRFCSKKRIGRWYKDNESDKVWWLDIPGSVGLHIFSFNKYDQFNLFQDYPYRLTEEQIEVFNRENPYWHSFFIDRFQ